MTNKPVSERELVLGILLEVTEHGGYSHLVLRDVLAKYQYLDKKERAFITRVSEGTLEHMMELDYILDQFSKVKVKKMKPVIRNLLRSAVYQLKYMDSVPDAAVCNESVKLAVKKGFGSLRGFVNGVLRNVARNLDNVSYPEDPVDNLSIRYSMPRWILELWIPAYGMENVERMLQSFQEEQPLVIRCRDEKVPEHLRAEGVHAEPHPYLPYAWQISGFDYLGGLESFQNGEFSVQDISSMLVGETADPQENDYVIDVCAAPGGKSTQLAGKMRGRGLLVCNEINPKRAKILASNIERLGIATALVLTEHPKKLEARFEGYFDKILVDAPCSGEGMFRKEEAAVTDWTEDTNAICANRQSEILTSAAKMLRPGGRLVYSTCTFSPVENEGVISDFLWRNPDFSVENRPAPDFSPGRPDWVEHPAPGLEHTFRLWPHKLRGEGHYAAVLKKAGDAPAAELPLEPAAKTPAELTQFCRQTGAALPEGKLLLFGQVAYLVPQGLPEIKGLRVLRAGLELGQTMRNRFEPAHAWALWLKGLENSVSLAADAPELGQYLSGNVLPSGLRGWTLVRVDGLSLGWAKGDGTQLKNHYPKALRRPV